MSMPTLIESNVVNQAETKCAQDVRPHSMYGDMTPTNQGGIAHMWSLSMCGNFY